MVVPMVGGDPNNPNPKPNVTETQCFTVERSTVLQNNDRRHILLYEVIKPKPYLII